MEIVIKKLAKGHFITIKHDDGTIDEVACGKWHSVVSAIRPYLYDRHETPKKKTRKKSKKKRTALSTVSSESKIN